MYVQKSFLVSMTNCFSCPYYVDLSGVNNEKEKKKTKSLIHTFD